MPAKFNWTYDQDERIRSLIPGGRITFANLAREWNMARWTVRERARTLGVDVEAFFVPPQNRVMPPDVPPPTYREPLPAGHPVPWGAITAGTSLDGAGYGS